MSRRRPPTSPGRPVPRGRASRLAAAALALVVGAGAPLALGGTASAAPQPRATGSPLVNETFTQATAPEFTGVGASCLTGAPTAATPPPSGSHPLGGCAPTAIGPVPPNNAAPHGFLRLTDAAHFQSSAVLYNHAIPAGQGLDVTFDQYQYGSTTPARPADGISFFLVDGAASLTHPGAFGGSLGYAQLRENNNPDLPFQPGVDHGYLGVGLDVYGNFFGDGEGRGNGCPNRAPSMESWPPPGPNIITLRGPGNGDIGYCFITATTTNFTGTGPYPSTLPGSLQGPTTELPPGVTPQEAEQLLEPDRRRVNVHITPAPNPVVTVTVDFNDGSGPHQVLSAPAPQPMPSTFKFGFASSTGANTDVHLIRNVVVHSAEPLPQLNLVKQVRQPLPGDLTVGSQVPYEFVVTNSGNTDITDLAVNDPKIGPVSCPTTNLAVGQTVTCTATYTVTAADAASGSIDNTAVATGLSDDEEVTSPPSSETVPIQRPPALEVDKEVTTPGPYSVGQTVTYRYTVRNTGGTRLNDITVHDDRVTDITCESTSLAPAEEPGDTTTCTGTYTITAADGTAGSVTNTATVTGTTDGETVTSPETEATLPVGQPHVTVTKRVTSSGPYQVGSRVDYAYTVTNTGSTPLHNVMVLDDHASDVTCDATTLAPGASTTCHGSYTITQADIDTCREGGATTECVITNVAQAGGTDPQGREIVSEPAEANVTVPITEPRLTLDKRVTSSGPYQVGSTVEYTYTVHNTGNTTLHDVRVSDDRVGDVICGTTTLAPGASTTCHGSYTITQADIDACRNSGDTTQCVIVNVARASATDPQGREVVSELAVASVTVPLGESRITLRKRVVSTGPFEVGSRVEYAYTVTNTGSTTLRDVRVNDDLVTGVTCDATTLAPGASTTCHGTFTVTQADLDRCADGGKGGKDGYGGKECVITNTARATGTDPDGNQVVSEPARASITVNGEPGKPGKPCDYGCDDRGKKRADS
ncbi:DUF7507 domain-containing protein [Streptomyces sp. F-1]|uniref:DUF7507 domain-containing protein n=1 Tax=Streptomyces sp. F-1 TaxID=463642 RepID=UPI0015A5B94D|nr:DUF11 domain-containing protein [Streptomyces sp. F-1]